MIANGVPVAGQWRGCEGQAGMTDATAWQGAVGDVWAKEWRRTDRSFSDLSRHLDRAIAAVAPERGRACDIGCGAGSTSLALAGARPELDIVGVDLSAALVDIARSRAMESPRLRFLAGDVEQVAPALGRCDLFLSRHGVMFFPAPLVAFRRLRDAAVDGAPFVFSCFRTPAENGWATGLVEAVTGKAPVAATGYAPGPFGFAEPVFVADMLRDSGWHGGDPVAVDYVYRAGAGDDPVEDALAFFCRIGPAAAALSRLAANEREPARDRMRCVLRRHVSAGGVDFAAAAWIWTARAA